MTLFLDSSMVLAACGRPAGASHAIFDFAPRQGWRLVAGSYVLWEVEKNVSIAWMPPHAPSGGCYARPWLSWQTNSRTLVR